MELNPRDPSSSMYCLELSRVHGTWITWNSRFHGIPCIPWKSRDIMEFHGIHGSPWNSMEFHGIQGIPKLMDIDESLTVNGMSSGVEVKRNYPGIVWLRAFKKQRKNARNALR